MIEIVGDLEMIKEEVMIEDQSQGIETIGQVQEKKGMNIEDMKAEVNQEEDIQADTKEITR